LMHEDVRLAVGTRNETVVTKDGIPLYVTFETSLYHLLCHLLLLPNTATFLVRHSSKLEYFILSTHREGRTRETHSTLATFALAVCGGGYFLNLHIVPIDDLHRFDLLLEGLYGHLDRRCRHRGELVRTQEISETQPIIHGGQDLTPVPPQCKPQLMRY
uniref:WH1 domain-containing protein n=1 Tax=Haemonchus placei TaxID=6290 RepID=A0A0N4WWQ1_HAEPC